MSEWLLMVGAKPAAVSKCTSIPMKYGFVKVWLILWAMCIIARNWRSCYSMQTKDKHKTCGKVYADSACANQNNDKNQARKNACQKLEHCLLAESAN